MAHAATTDQERLSSVEKQNYETEQWCACQVERCATDLERKEFGRGSPSHSNCCR